MPHLDHSVRLDFKDVLIRPKRSTIRSRADVELARHFNFKYAKKTLPDDVVPIISANMDTIGTFGMAVALAEHKLLTAIHKHYPIEEWQKFAKENPTVLPYTVASCGMADEDVSRLQQILDACPAVPGICLDVANGYSEHFVEFVKTVRNKFPEHIIILINAGKNGMQAVLASLCSRGVRGNVVTGEMVEQLILNGADIVKVGIGPGSVCTTRRQTGVGYPQLSAVLECADAAHGLKGHIISDGGCTCPGDVSKAFGAGADFVMMGGMFAGHDQSGGELIERDGKKYKIFYGMSSSTAMQKHAGGVANYRSSEGKTVEVPYRGNVHDTVKDILGGVRSTCTYVGAEKLKELSRRTTFIRVTMQLNNVFS